MRPIIVLKYLPRKPKILPTLFMLGGMAKRSPLAVLGENVYRLRESRGWSQGNLGKRAGVSQKVISNLEHAEERCIHPTMETIIGVANAFGVPVYVLFMPLRESILMQINNGMLEQIISTYLELPASGQATVNRVMQLESNYKFNQQ